MSNDEAGTPSVTLRELNQHSGRIVARVGETRMPVVVTDRGRPVARIEPYSEPRTPLDRLMADGQVDPPVRGFTLDMPTIPLPEGISVADLLAEDREEAELTDTLGRTDDR